MGPSIQTNSTTTWTRRVDRARELAQQHTAVSDMLSFYALLLEFQAQIAKSVHPRIDPSLPFRDQIDYSVAVRNFPRLLTLVQTHAPAPLAKAAKHLEEQGQTTWQRILASPSAESDLDWFFSRACLQPIAENLQSQYPESTDQAARLCPACDSFPQLVILRPEGEGARRSLQCSFCLREWAFRRVLCPYCGELDKEKLPRYGAEECQHVRVEACDTCRRYLKSVDLSLDGLAIPLVDEVALSALDLWALNQGFVKIEKNLVGI